MIAKRKTLKETQAVLRLNRFAEEVSQDCKNRDLKLQIYNQYMLPSASPLKNEVIAGVAARSRSTQLDIETLSNRIFRTPQKKKLEMKGDSSPYIKKFQGSYLQTKRRSGKQKCSPVSQKLCVMIKQNKQVELAGVYAQEGSRYKLVRGKGPLWIQEYALRPKQRVSSRIQLITL